MSSETNKLERQKFKGLIRLRTEAELLWGPRQPVVQRWREVQPSLPGLEFSGFQRHALAEKDGLHTQQRSCWGDQWTQAWKESKKGTGGGSGHPKGLLLKPRIPRKHISSTGAGGLAMKQIGQNFLVTGQVQVGLGVLACISEMSVIRL